MEHGTGFHFSSPSPSLSKSLSSSIYHPLLSLTSRSISRSLRRRSPLTLRAHSNTVIQPLHKSISAMDKLSYSIKILLESAIRNCDNFQVTKNDVEKIIDWENTSPKQVEIPFKPARVLLQVNAYCGDQNLQSYDAYNSWLNISESVLNKKCGVDGDDKPFDFGIFEQALSSGIVYSKNFISKYCYCMWWGLQNLSCSTLGQGLQTSTYPGESIFSIALAIFGLILFALLIGNMQVPVDLVIDHSVQVDVARHENAVQANMDLEFKRNYERFAFLKWGSTAFQNMLVVPPGSGIVHQSSGFGPDK